MERKTRGDKTTFAYAGAFKPLAPLLILTGELDDWTRPSRAANWRRPRAPPDIR